MGNSNASRKIFEQLDKEQDGKITLQELVANSDNTDSSVPTLCSLTTLYHFDYEKEGSLNYKEFVELEKFVQKIQKKCVKLKRKKHHEEEPLRVKNLMSILLRKLNHDGEESAHHHSNSHGGFTSHQSSPIQRNGGIMNGNGMIKSISTNSLSLNDRRARAKGLSVTLDNIEKSCMSNNSSNVSTPVSMHTSYSRSNVHSEESESSDDDHSPRKTLDPETDAETIHEIKDQIAVELQHSLNKEAFSKQGRKDFLTWLFKLTDTSKDGEITHDELACMLTAVEKDEIDLRSLLFDDNDPSLVRNHESIVNCIMSEYDSRKAGSLSKSDFLKLSDIILSKYEARQKQCCDGWVVGDWKMLHKLGEGGYGIVRYATRIHPQPNQPSQAAIKIIKRGNV